MKAIKDAIYARLTGDVGAGHIMVLATGGVSYARPEGTPVNWELTHLTYQLVDFAGEESRSSIADQTYQFDAWGQDPDVLDSIAGRIGALFVDEGAAPLIAFNRRVDSIRRLGEPELYEEDIRVHHKVVLLRIISFPA